MGYIVDLTVILDDIFRTNSGFVSVDALQLAINRQFEFGRRDRIHREIRSFVSETFPIRFTVTQMYYPMYEVLTDGSSDSMLNCIPRAVWLGGYQNRLT